MCVSRQTVFSICAALILIVVFAAAEFFNLWVNLGLPRSSEWFADFHALVAAAECEAKGINVFLVNPCDHFDRVHVYSRLWFVIDDLGIDADNYLIWGFIVSTLFVITFLIILKPSNKWQFFVATALLVSPAIMLGIERANNDLIIFCLLVIICALISSTNLLKQTFAYLLIGLSALLKFYPLVAFILYVVTTRSNKYFWLITVLTILITVCSVLFMLSDFQQLALPTPSNRWTFGARYIFQIPFETWPYFKITLLLWALLSGAAFLIAKPSSTTQTPNIHFNTLLFIAGSSISLVTFVLGNNYDYRCIFLLLCVPLLFNQVQNGKQHNNAIITISLLVLIVWWEFVIQTSLWISNDNSTLFQLVRWIEQVLTWALMIRLLWMIMPIVKTPLLQRLLLKAK